MDDATEPSLDQARCCDLVDGEIARIAAVTGGADPATPVPTCPGWTIADLLVHVGEIYRWVAAMVRGTAQQRVRREAFDWQRPSDPAGLPGWVAGGAAEAVAVLRASDPTTPMWAWGSPKNAGFWPRRMVHEMGVHRADAELALGIPVVFDPGVAADGVSELLGNIPEARTFAPHVERLRGDGQTLELLATDIGARWVIRFEPDGYRWARLDRRQPAEETTDVEVGAPARDLLLALYGRPACVTVKGDEDLFDHWLANSGL